MLPMEEDEPEEEFSGGSCAGGRKSSAGSLAGGSVQPPWRAAAKAAVSKPKKRLHRGGGVQRQEDTIQLSKAGVALLRRGFASWGGRKLPLPGWQKGAWFDIRAVAALLERDTEALRTALDDSGSHGPRCEWRGPFEVRARWR